MAGWLEAGAGVARSWVLVPMTAKLADGARDIVVLDTAIRPPGVRVWPATTNSDAELAVYVDPATESTGGDGEGSGFEASVPATRFPEGAKE